ncbi:ROK family protein, partial [bacterium]
TKIAGSGLTKSFFHKHGEHLTPEQILEGRLQGDPRCEDLFDQFLDDFGRCIGGLISMIDPDVIVLGGGLSNIDELYSTGVERARMYAFQNQFDTPILKNQLGDSAGVLGAAWMGV